MDGQISWRELRVLATIAFVTVAVVVGLGELGARWRWPQRDSNACLSTRSHGEVRASAGCSTVMKTAEGPWTTMAYNECGFRSVHQCGEKAPGVRRVLIMGSSIAEGLFVRAEEHFGVRLEHALAARCPFPVEVLNVSASGSKPSRQHELIAELLPLKPDLVVVAFAPYDLLDFSGDRGPGNETEVHDRMLNPFTRLRLLARESRAALMLQHFFFSSARNLVSAYQVGKTDDALSVPMSIAYKTRYRRLQLELGMLSSEFSKVGAHVILAPIPNRIQGALLSNGIKVAGRDPLLFSREMSSVALRSGVTPADVAAEFAATRQAERLFYVVDSHPTGEANALIARSIDRAVDQGVASNQLPAFAGCRAI
jgi:hypothetical protein